MSDNQRADRLPPVPRDLPMPPYHFQRDKGGSGSVGTKPAAADHGLGILVGANLLL